MTRSKKNGERDSLFYKKYRGVAPSWFRQMITRRRRRRDKQSINAGKYPRTYKKDAGQKYN